MGKNPVEAMENRARELVLRAMESGWTGPPFDPIKLAELLDIKVTASGEVSDARTLSHGGKALHIEYNPNRPRGRIRFSIAHEIAHSFFADCHEKIRYRHKPEMSSDDWQLESLCNIGASELVMPIGSNPHFQFDDVSIGQVLNSRRKYDVSTEALLIRLAKLASQPLAIFCASRLDKPDSADQFRIDYAIPSKLYPYRNLPGITFKSELLAECTAIGYSISGKQTLPISRESHYMECVGLPPYPGGKFPRIAGILFANKSNMPELPHIKYHEGDATIPGGTRQKIIAHIVNDKTPNWGGGGFAVSLRKRYPVTQKDFKEWSILEKDNLCLGRSHFVTISDGLHAFSMVAQHGYGASANPRVRYRALETCLTNLRYRAEKLEASIHMPRIGVGNAGGDWSVIEEIVLDTLVNEGVEVNVYDFVPPAKSMTLAF